MGQTAGDFMTADGKEVVTATRTSTVKRLLDSMWFYWMLLLGISFAIAAAIYWIWLRGTV
jgi:hypothetical protein